MSATSNTTLQIQPDKRTYSVPEIAGILGISRSKAYALCKEASASKGMFKILRIGKAVRISKASFDQWLEQD